MAGEPEGSGRRKGRGRLSSIEMLPEIAYDAIAWAKAELDAERLPQVAILDEFNERLADLGIKPVSKGAFSRWSVRKALERQKIARGRDLSNSVLDRFDVRDRSTSTLALVEMVKVRLQEMVDGDDIDADGLTLALNRLSAIARREQQLRHAEMELSRAEAEREQAERDRAATASADKVETIATEAGLTADRIAAIRKGVLGLGQ